MMATDVATAGRFCATGFLAGSGLASHTNDPRPMRPSLASTCTGTPPRALGAYCGSNPSSSSSELHPRYTGPSPLSSAPLRLRNAGSSEFPNDDGHGTARVRSSPTATCHAALEVPFSVMGPVRTCVPLPLAAAAADSSAVSVPIFLRVRLVSSTEVA